MPSRHLIAEFVHKKRKGKRQEVRAANSIYKGSFEVEVSSGEGKADWVFKIFIPHQKEAGKGKGLERSSEGQQAELQRLKIQRELKDFSKGRRERPGGGKNCLSCTYMPELSEKEIWGEG